MPRSEISPFLSATFTCNWCNYQATIRIKKPYTLFAKYESNQQCCYCKQLKPIVAAGELIYRKDLYGGRKPTWEIQFASLQADEQFCLDCKTPERDNWKKLIPWCSRCNGFMEYSGDS